MKVVAPREQKEERGGRGEARIPLAEVVDFIRGVSFDKAEASYDRTEGHVPILRAGNIGDELTLDDDLVWVPPARVGEEQMLQVGDLAICMSSGSPAVVGKTAQLREEWRGSVGAFCGIIRPRTAVHAGYLGHWFRSEDFRAWRDEQARGANIQNLRFSELGELEIPLPPLAEQERIAGLLTEQLGAVERARAAAAERLAAAEALPAALLREVFGDAPPFDASPLAPSEPTKPGWTWCRLTSLARLATGHTPSRRCPEYWNGDIPWIQLPDIRALDGRVAMDTSEHTNALGIENSAAVRLPAGTVCLSRTASVGFVTVMGREMATSQDFVNWVCGPDLDPSFLMHLFIACRKPIRDLGSGAVHHTIYFPTVEQFSVCVPDVVTQRRLAAELTQRIAAAEGVIARCSEELAAIEALPAALLRDAFGQQSS